MSSPNIHIPAFSKRERKYSRTHPNNIINNLLLRSLNINYFSTVCNSNDEVELLGSIQANSLSMSSWVNLFLKMYMGFPGGASGKEPACRCRRHKRRGFNPWVGKIPWRRAWQPIPVFLPIDSHGQRSLAGYSLWGCKESNTTEASEHYWKCTHLSMNKCFHDVFHRILVIQSRAQYSNWGRCRARGWAGSFTTQHLRIFNTMLKKIFSNAQVYVYESACYIILDFLKNCIHNYDVNHSNDHSQRRLCNPPFNQLDDSFHVVVIIRSVVSDSLRSRWLLTVAHQAPLSMGFPR